MHHFDIIRERLRTAFPKPAIRDVHSHILEVNFQMATGNYLVHYFGSDNTYSLEYGGAMVLSTPDPDEIADFMLIK